MTSLLCPPGPLSPFTPGPHHATPSPWTEAKQKSWQPMNEERDREGDKDTGPRDQQQACRNRGFVQSQPRSPSAQEVITSTLKLCSVAREIGVAWKPVAGRGRLALVPGACGSSSCHSQPLVSPAQGWGWGRSLVARAAVAHLGQMGVHRSGSHLPQLLWGKPCKGLQPGSHRWTSKVMGTGTGDESQPPHTSIGRLMH